MKLTNDCVSELNAILNHPDIFPGHLSDEPIDVSPLIDNGGFGVIGEGYGFLLHPLSPGVLEVHSSIMPEHRSSSLDITLRSADKVFTETYAMEIVTRIKDNRPARGLAIAAGMRKIFERNGFEFFSLPISIWASKCDRFMALGEHFHEVLEEHGIESGHGDDSNHDHYVGIALQMSRFLPHKAEWFYNNWAALSGFHPVKILPDGNADIGNAIVGWVNDEIEVIKCQ